MFTHSTNHPSAKVADGNLIVSLPGAKNPVVWRMALGEARAAALEVQSGEDVYLLVLKYPKGDMIEIAQFDDKQAAADALMAVSKAMQTAHGHHGAREVSASAASGGSWKWLIPLGVILLALFLFTRTASMVPVADGQDVAARPAANDQTGVPLSADSYLGGL